MNYQTCLRQHSVMVSHLEDEMAACTVRSIHNNRHVGSTAVALNGVDPCWGGAGAHRGCGPHRVHVGWWCWGDRGISRGGERDRVADTRHWHTVAVYTVGNVVNGVHHGLGIWQHKYICSTQTGILFVLVAEYIKSRNGMGTGFDHVFKQDGDKHWPCHAQKPSTVTLKLPLYAFVKLRKDSIGSWQPHCPTHLLTLKGITYILTHQYPLASKTKSQNLACSASNIRGATYI